MKDDLAGGRLPSGDFGENAAWWLIMLLAFNLSALMTHLVLPSSWASKRLKAIRFGLINLAGRVVDSSRQLIVRLSGNHPSTELLLDVRHRILQLALVPYGSIGNNQFIDLAIFFLVWGQRGLLRLKFEK